MPKIKENLGLPPKGTSLRQYLSDLQERYPIAEFYVKGVHYNTDDDVEDIFDGRIILISSFSNSIMIKGNPWQDEGEYYAGYSPNSDTYVWFTPRETVDAEEDRYDFLWVLQSEVKELYMVLPVRNNKEAARTLEKY